MAATGEVVAPAEVPEVRVDASRAGGSGEADGAGLRRQLALRLEELVEHVLQSEDDVEGRLAPHVRLVPLELQPVRPEHHIVAVDVGAVLRAQQRAACAHHGTARGDVGKLTTGRVHTRFAAADAAHAAPLRKLRQVALKMAHGERLLVLERRIRHLSQLAAPQHGHCLLGQLGLQLAGGLPPRSPDQVHPGHWLAGGGGQCRRHGGLLGVGRGAGYERGC
jgi:hypothetical protein